MASTASGGKGLGKWFPFGKKKKSKMQDNGSGESDEEGYQDPAAICPTEPPTFARGPVPDYPPPRPSSNLQSGVPPNRPFSSIELGGAQHSQQGGRHASMLTNKSNHSRTIESRVPSTRDDYFEPWDSKINVQGKEKPQLKPKPKVQQTIEPQAPSSGDNYMEPWDSAKPVSNTVKIPVVKDGNYIEPWDSANQSITPKSSFEEEEEDYTVPYDSGKDGVMEMLSRGIPRQERQLPSTSEDQFYDVPYEDGENAGQAGFVRKPQQDDGDYDEPWESRHQVAKGRLLAPPHKGLPHRPAPNQSHPIAPMMDGNYDQPWESKPLAEMRAKLPVEHLDIDKRHSKPPVSKTHSNSSMVAATQPSFEVDPTIPLENQAWFHGGISRIDAEGRLKGVPNYSYLIRESETAKGGGYSLSVINNNSPMHLRISTRDGKYVLGQHSRPYNSIPEMVHHYSQNALNIRGAEQVRLIYPVLQESVYFTVEPGA